MMIVPDSIVVMSSVSSPVVFVTQSGGVAGLAVSRSAVFFASLAASASWSMSTVTACQSLSTVFE